MANFVPMGVEAIVKDLRSFERDVSRMDSLIADAASSSGKSAGALGTNISELFAQTGKMLDSTGKQMKAWGGSFTKNVTAPLVGIGAVALKFSTDLNESMANVASLGLLPERVVELKGNVQELAIATGKSTGDMADGLYQVVSAFGDSAESATLLEINAKAATAGIASTTDAINLTSAVTKGYGDTSADAVQKVADLAFQTVKMGQTTFPELASSMGKVVPIAAALGVSQEELFAQMSTLTGVTGSAAEVSTQLRAVFQGILKPTGAMAKAIGNVSLNLERQGVLVDNDLVKAWKEAESRFVAATDSVTHLERQLANTNTETEEGARTAKLLEDELKKSEKQVKEYGKAVDNAAAALGPAIVETVGMTGALELLSDEAGGNTNELAKMFGSVEGLNAVLALSGGQADIFAEKLAAMSDVAGETEKAFAAQTEGINKAGFTMKQLRSQAQVLAERLGDGLAPALLDVLEIVKPLIERAIDIATKFSEMDEGQKKLILTIIAVVAAIGPALTILGTLFTSLGTIVSVSGTLIGVFTGGGGVVAAISGGGGIVAALGLLLNPITLAVLAVAGLGIAWSTDFMGIRTTTQIAVNDIGNKLGKFKDETSAQWTALTDGMKTGWTLFTDDFSSSWKSATDGTLSVAEAWDQAFGSRLDVMMDVAAAGWNAFTGGIFGEWKRTTTETTVTAEDWRSRVTVIMDNMTRDGSGLSSDMRQAITTEFETLMRDGDSLSSETRARVIANLERMATETTATWGGATEATTEMTEKWRTQVEGIMTRMLGESSNISIEMRQAITQEFQGLMQDGDSLSNETRMRVVQNLTTMAQDARTNSSTMNTDILNGLRKLRTDASAETNEMGISVLNRLRRLRTDMGEEANQISTSVTSRWATFTSNLNTRWRSGLSEIQASLTTSGARLKADMDTLGTALVSNMANGLSRAQPTLTTAARNINDMLMSTIDKAQDWLRIGGHLVDGLVSGVQSAAQRAASAVGNFVDGLVSNVRGLLGIRSRSQVFYDIAGWMVAGLVGGIQDRASDAIYVMGQLSAEMIGVIQATEREINQSLLNTQQATQGATQGTLQGPVQATFGSARQRFEQLRSGAANLQTMATAALVPLTSQLSLLRDTVTANIQGLTGSQNAEERRQLQTLSTQIATLVEQIKFEIQSRSGQAGFSLNLPANVLSQLQEFFVGRLETGQALLGLSDSQIQETRGLIATILKQTGASISDSMAEAVRIMDMFRDDFDAALATFDLTSIAQNLQDKINAELENTQVTMIANLVNSVSEWASHELRGADTMGVFFDMFHDLRRETNFGKDFASGFSERLFSLAESIFGQFQTGAAIDRSAFDDFLTGILNNLTGHSGFINQLLEILPQGAQLKSEDLVLGEHVTVERFEDILDRIIGPNPLGDEKSNLNRFTNLISWLRREQEVAPEFMQIIQRLLGIFQEAELIAPISTMAAQPAMAGGTVNVTTGDINTGMDLATLIGFIRQAVAEAMP